MGGNHLEKDRWNTQFLQLEVRESWEGEVAVKKY